MKSKSPMFLSPRAEAVFEELKTIALQLKKDDLANGTRAVKLMTIEDVSLKMTISTNYFRLIAEAMKTASEIDREEQFLVARVKLIQDDMNKE
jgi:hypothetical protein